MWPPMMGYGYMSNWAQGANLPYPTMFLFMILAIIIWGWALLDCARRDFRNSIEKTIWILAMIFTPFIAIIAYIIVIRASNPHGIMKNGGK